MSDILPQLNWDNFGLKGESKEKSFEDLCMFLLCRELKITEIEAYHNQPGIETEPFEVNGKKYGFQAKFFSGKFDWEQIRKSVDKAIDRYPELDKIFIYSNKRKTGGRQAGGKTKNEIYLENTAKKRRISLKYITDQDILLKLSQPSNLDLSQLYFGVSDELGFIRSSVNPKILTFIQSKEYLDLPIEKEGETLDLNSFTKEILKDSKVSLLLGNPGSGKTILMHKLLEVFGGLDKDKRKEQIRTLIANNAVPILINLKNCTTDSLENILRGRRNDNIVNGQNLNFIYLFDGLDELDEKIADNILLQIHELTQKTDTKKIIISCRLGNINRLKAKTYFENIEEYKIAELDYTFISEYFEKKGAKDKIEKLEQLERSNEGIFQEIKDILLIKLFWDSIDEIDEGSTIIDLFDKRISLLLTNPNHKKEIDNLNLLNPKENAILELNKDIAFESQKTFQLRFSQEDLQALILKKFPKLDYKSVNQIVNYIANLFFENSYFDGKSIIPTTYIYQHRRYQEYFFTQKLKEEYEKNPKIIRELKVVSNKEYLENLFLKYLRKEYEKENNLAGCIELNLIDVYLGKHPGWGADNPYYLNSNEFIPALVSQEEGVLNELLEDKNLKLKDKILIDISEVKKQFKLWENDKENYRATKYLKDIWENGVSSLIESIALFWKTNKKDIAKKLIRQFNILYNNYKFIENLRKEEKELLYNPCWRQFENWIYFQLVIEKKEVQDIFKKLIRGNYENVSEYRTFGSEESGKERLVKSFFRVCLKNRKDELFKLISNFDKYEFTTFLDVLRTVEYLPIFFQSKSIHNRIKRFIKDFTQELNEKNAFILFYKKYFNILSKNEKEFAKSELERLRKQIATDCLMYKTHIDFALMSYVLDKFSFEKFLESPNESSFRYYNELGLYSALYRDYIELLYGKRKIEAIVRDYLRYINLYTKENYNKQYKKTISFLWAHIFVNSRSEPNRLLNLKSILIKEENNIIPFSFYWQLNLLDSNLYSKIINERELRQFEDELLSWEQGFPAYIDECFHLSIFYSKVNPRKAKYYFEKGIIEGILRHGWQKDTIVSYQLVEALEILWRNNWETKEKLEEYSKKVFELTLRVSDITDEDGTGPYNVIELLSIYDLKLAEDFKRKLIEKKGRRNVSNRVVTEILKAKVRLGFPIKDIENGMKEYRKDYDYEGRPIADYYEQKFVVYLEIAKNDLYLEEEKQYAFEKMWEIVDTLRMQGIKYYLKDIDINEKLRYQNWCKQYKKKSNLELAKEENNTTKKKNISEEEFVRRVKECSTKRQVIGKYRQLNNYRNNIILSKYESWRILVEKTFSITGNIKIFTDYLKRNYFPHTAFRTGRLKHFHLGIAAALKNINTKQEMLNYLFKNSGHGGFVNIMKAYEILEDKNMCLTLFSRYLKFCELIVS